MWRRQGRRSWLSCSGADETRRSSIARADPRPLLTAALASMAPQEGRDKGLLREKTGPECPLMVCCEQDPLQPWYPAPSEPGTCAAVSCWLRWPGGCLPALRCDYRLCGQSLCLGWVRQDWERGLPCPSRGEWVQGRSWQPRGAPWRRPGLATPSSDHTSAAGPG